MPLILVFLKLALLWQSIRDEIDEILKPVLHPTVRIYINLYFAELSGLLLNIAKIQRLIFSSCPLISGFSTQQFFQIFLKLIR